VADRSVLPLTTALGYATGVAESLRERRGETPAHTNGAPDLVPAGPLDPVRHSSEHSSRQAEQDSDIVAFGALLYELMTGSKPPQDESQVRSAIAFRRWVLKECGPPPHAWRSAVWLAIRKACDRILMELRLYSVIDPAK
jgi:hypothetical protein